MTTQAQATTADPKPGLYKGRALLGSQQYDGGGQGGTPAVFIDFKVTELGVTRTVPLYFSQAAAPYSFERLKACGWEGSDLSDLTGVDKNEVMLRLDYETYDGKTRPKWQIESGAGRFTAKDPVDPKAFAAKVAAITGAPVGPAANGNVKPPPF